jgi:uncharacterized protein YlxW (UPF0749 family)
MTNINTKFRRLVGECDALQEKNQNISNEKKNLESFVNQLKATNEKDSKTINDLEQRLHEVNTYVFVVEQTKGRE